MADTTADYVVIGAGLAGLTAARALSQLGGKGKVLTSFSTATTGTNRLFSFPFPDTAAGKSAGGSGQTLPSAGLRRVSVASHGSPRAKDIFG